MPIVERIIAKDETKKGFLKAEANAKKFAKGFGKSLSPAVLAGGAAGIGLAVGQAIIGGLRKAKDFLVSTFSAFGEQEAISAKLRQSIANTGAEWDVVGGKVTGLLDELQAKTKFGDDESARYLSFLLETTGDLDAAMGQLPLALDLVSSGLVREKTAAKLLAEAQSGNIAAVAAYVPSLRNLSKEQIANMDATQRAEVALAALQERFGGLAEAEGRTFAGTLAKIKNAFGDMKEAIGSALVNIIDTGDGMLGLRDAFKDAEKWILENTGSITKWGRVAISTVNVVWQYIKLSLNGLWNIWKITWNGAQTVFYDTFIKVTETFNTLFIKPVTKAIDFLNDKLGLDIQVDLPDLDATLAKAREARDKNLNETKAAMKEYGTEFINGVKDTGKAYLNAWKAINADEAALQDEAAKKREERLKQEARKANQIAAEEAAKAGGIGVGSAGFTVGTGEVVEPVATAPELDPLRSQGKSVTDYNTTDATGPKNVKELQFSDFNSEFQNLGMETLGLDPDQLASYTAGFDEMALAVNSVADGAMNLGSAFSDAFMAVGQGGNVFKGLGEAAKAMVAETAAAQGRLSFAEGARALAAGIFGNPAAFAAAAQYFAAGTAFMTLAGALGGGGASGGGRAGAGNAGGLGDNSLRDTTDPFSSAKGTATIVVEGGLLDLSDPRQQLALENALNDLDGKRVTIRGT